MSDPAGSSTGPTCLFDHGPMQPVDDGRWECILCSFVVITGPGEATGDSAESGAGNAA